MFQENSWKLIFWEVKTCSRKFFLFQMSKRNWGKKKQGKKLISLLMKVWVGPTIILGNNLALPSLAEDVFCLAAVVQLLSRSVMSDSLQPHGLQLARLPCPSPSLRACSNSCSLSQWCHPTVLASVIPFSSCFQSFPASESFLMSWHFTSGGQSIGVSYSRQSLLTSNSTPRYIP